MAAPQTEIVVTRGGAEIARKTVPPGEYILGRDPECDVVIDADAVSRRHAKLTVNFDHALIEDLGSSNGTFVAGRKIAECARLFPNQPIQIGVATVNLRRIKSDDPDALLSPHLEAVRRYLPPEFLQRKKYDIGSVLAQGGMGTILHAQEKLLRRQVAMKRMTATGSQEDLVRFLEEAQITGQLEHPNIVPVYELGVDEEEQVFYTMKLVRGATLQKVLDDVAAIRPEAVKKYQLNPLLTIFLKVCDALAFAHNKGVIHRDLKPDNIMIGEYGEVLVMDWGLARASGKNESAGAAMRTLVSSTRQDEGEAMRTVMGMVFGTPQYMAPEQARGETTKLDARSDVYSLGAILYHVLTLEPPISGEDVRQVLQSVAMGNVAGEVVPAGPKRVKPQRSRPHLPGGKIPPQLAEFARKAMALNQNERYQSVKELQLAVQSYFGGAPQAPPPATVKPPSAQPAVVGKKTPPVLVVALCGVIALLGAFAVKLNADKVRAQAELRAATQPATAP